ncbi:transcriptional regulator STERILE APETALA-like [Impatiens glandulifera]|uniref:transcriptional regulator STERILE APETALA-like n=1 Tax=Impatiens glandulifera TaxID=253017 RepID=UPI001FB1156A|nr:transcriptional regulator STERILE APETALA-like [Impatiens glandulifera]
MSNSSSSEEEEEGDNIIAGNDSNRGEYEPPSPSRRMRSSAGDVRVWPEPFIEALAFQVAVDASDSIGRFAVAPALFNLFLVCSTWREVSRSELLWKNLTRHVWNRHHLLQPHHTWREEYVFRHRTHRNFRTRRHSYSTLHFNDNVEDDDDEENVLSCRRLALSDRHLAAGFSDGSVRLFHLQSRIHLYTFLPNHRDLLGRFSCAVSGIILSEIRLVFASHDGDIHVAPIDNSVAARRARYGDALNDGVLVDFSGSNRWWVGLYAGVPGRAFHVWDAESEELVFVGGTLTDSESVMGWNLLTELTNFVGRVRVTNHGLAIACTSHRVMVFDLGNLGFIVAEEAPRRGVLVGSVDSNGESMVLVDRRGMGRVRVPGTLEEACRFVVRGAAAGRMVVGCMNMGFVVMCIEGRWSVWEAENGGYLYDLRERIGAASVMSVMSVDECHVAAWSSGDWSRIHLWDFGER